MDILQSIIIGAIGCIIGPKIQRYIEKKIKLEMAMLDIDIYHNYYYYYSTTRY